jgi:translocator protein
MTRSNKLGLTKNALGAVAVALITNAIVFLAGWNGADDGQTEASFAPPGAVIGIIWVVLFAMMGSARWFARSGRSAQQWITGLIVACALYPFYTGGLQTQWVALAGTVVTIVIAAVAVKKASFVSRNAALLTTPVIVWSVFATAIIVENLRLN